MRKFHFIDKIAQGGEKEGNEKVKKWLHLQKKDGVIKAFRLLFLKGESNLMYF